MEITTITETIMAIIITMELTMELTTHQKPSTTAAEKIT